MLGGIVIHVMERVSPITYVLRPFSNDRLRTSLTKGYKHYEMHHNTLPKYSGEKVMDAVKGEIGDANVTSK